MRARNMPWQLIGGAACLDFANTARWHGGRILDDHLGDRVALLSWARASQALVPLEVGSFPHLDLSQGLNRDNDPLLAVAKALRVEIHALFGATAQGRAPKADDLIEINAALARGPDHRKLVVSGGTVAWETGLVGPADHRLLWRIARSAAELLTGDQLARVKLCAMPDCGWLFLDDSRAGNRRWCSMETCGNRHKARRHYGRHKPGEIIGGTPSDGGERSSP